MFVVALPLKAVALSYTDSAAAREVKGSVARRGLCGDVYLVSQPPGPRISGTKVDGSMRERDLTFVAEVENLAPDTPYALRARILDDGRAIKELTSPHFNKRP
jgi:hypothetical protein